MKVSTIIAIAAMVLSAASTIWVGGFRFSALVQEVRHLGTRMDKLEVRIDKFEERMERRFERLENRMDNFQAELHKIDTRVSNLEQKGP